MCGTTRGGVDVLSGELRLWARFRPLAGWGLVALLAMVAYLVFDAGSAPAEPTCTDTWTGGGGSESWTTAGNWSAGVPGSTDVACIGSGVTVRVTTGSNSVASVQDEGTLVVSGGTLSLAEESGVSPVDSLSLTGGTLSVSGELDVASSLVSSGNATVSGAGRLVVASGASGSLGAGGCSLLTLSGVTLRNEGTVTLGASGGVSGQLDMAESSKLENTGTFYADSYPAGCVPGSNSASIQSNGGSPSVSNTGTFSADAGGVYAALVSVPFDNEGTVHVASGVLNPTGGGSSTEGTWTTASGTEVGFTTGSFSLTHDDASGAKLVLSGGTLSIATGTTTVGSLSLTGGTLSVSGELDVSGSLASSGNATVSGAGSLVVQSGATGALGAAGCSLLTLSGATLLNKGTVTLGASGGVSGQLDMAEGSKLENAGTFNVDSYPAGCVPGSNNASIQENSGSPSVSNAGTFNVGPGSGHTAGVSVPFSNTGTVHVASGVLNPTGGGSSTEGTWTTASGAEVGFTSGSFSLTGDDASGAKVALSGGTLSIATGTTAVDSFSLTGGTLSVSGQLDVASSFVSSGNTTVSGSGSLVVGPAATGSIGAGGCSLLTLSAATLLNEGTVTLGASGGVSGQLDMVEGAKLENAGTFNADSYPAGCVPGSNSAAIQNNGGSPSVGNTGVFNAGAGSGHTASVSVPFNNGGVVSAQSGTLQFSGGGVPEHVAVGSWGKESGASLVLSAGTFLIGEEVDLSQVEISGATVERMATEGAPNGSLSSLPYASGTVEASGTGHSIGSGFASALIEVTPSGVGEWASLCGPLTPGLGGEFGCAWNTLSGSYPDGHYRLRARLSDAASPPASGPTAAITILVDNTAPSGSLTPPTYIGGSATVTGTADDTGSGVGTWQLQITPAGTAEWGNACAAQSTPSSTDHYTCTPNTSGLTDGSYELRAVVTDKAGNTYTTSAGETTLDGTAPSGSLSTVSESGYVKGTLSLEGSASDSGSGVATWTAQIAPAGSSSWTNACSPQGTPISGSTYGCSVNTSGHTDGAYQLRALITDSAGNTHATTAQEVTFDNTPPSGSLDALGYYSTGVIEVKGSATDAGSGLASWQLEIKPTSGGSWESACLTQSVPLEGSVYGCSVDTTLLADGSYHLRATLTDNTGNTSVTSLISTHVNNLGEGEGPPECTDTWTGGASTEAWATAGNWSTGVPGSSDIACIGSGMTVRVTTGAQSVASLQAEGTLVISGGSLAIAEESEVSALDSLSLAGGTLSLAGDLHVTSSLESSESSTVNGAGRLVVQPGATGSLGAGGCSLLTLSGATLLNEGTITLGASGGVTGQLDMLEGAHLENTGTFNADSYSSGCVPGSNIAAIQSNGGSPSVTNTGTFNTGPGSGHTVMISAAFANEGTVHVVSGTFNPTGGGSSTGGTWTTASSTTVSFTTGTYSLTHDDASGAKLALGGGTLSIASGTTTVESLSLSGGTLSLTGELDVTSSLVSSESSTVSGAGRLVVQSGATGSLGAAGCSLLTLNGATLLNEGTITLGVSGGVAGQLDMLEGAHLENAGTFNADSYSSGCVPGSNSAAIQSNSGSPSFVNTGTLNAGAGSGHTVLVSVPFSNTGTVHVASGGLNPIGGGSSTEGTWTTASATTISFTTGTYSLTNDDASGADFALSGGTLSIATGTTSVDTLSLSGGTLSLTGDLDVTSSLATSESMTVSGAGRLVVQPGATGTLGASGCSLLTLNGATLRNEGTVTLGASGGASGQLDMLEGAHLENTGTFNLDSYPSGCVPGSNSASIQNNGGSPTASNTGTFNANVGSEHTATVSVPFNNDGTVTAQSGTLQFSGGGIPATVATGAWAADEGAAIVLSSGTFLIGSSVDLSQVEVTGATVTREEGSGPPSGSLTPRSYAAGTATVAGSGESVGSGFAAATIEVTPASTSEWHSLCGPLTPASGAFSCSWTTTGGSYPDGSYHLRAQLSDSSSPANTAPTATITVLVDNTAPTGTQEAPSSALSGSSLITGTAGDSGSGIAAWQLQITPAGTSEWANACPSQNTPITTGVYGCSIETTEHEDGAYQLRAIITDNAGNTHTTTPVEAEIHNAESPTAPSNTAAPTISGEARTGQTLSAAHGTWSGTPTISYAYQWQRCNEAGGECADISGQTSSTYTLGEADVGATVRVVVNASNSAGSASANSTVSGMVVEGLVNTTAPSISGSAQDGQTLTANAGTWTGSGTITYAYQWESCSSGGEECAPIPEATAQTYTLESVDLGTTLRVLVTATNSTESQNAPSVVTGLVEPGAPTELDAPWISGTPSAGQTLYVYPGIWGGTEVHTAVQWRRCNSFGVSCVDITGATEPEYQLTESDIGHTVRAEVQASNELGSMSDASPASPVVGAALTLVDSSPPTVTGTPQSANTLTAHTGSWSGEGTISYAYQWQACDKFGTDCQDITGATSSTYTLSSENVDTTVGIIITASDTNGSLSVASAATQPIASATAPVVAAAPSITGTDQEGQTLTASTGEWSGEGTITYTYQWERCAEEGQDCADIAGAITSTYLLTMGDVGSTVRVVVSATDGGGSTVGVSAPSEPILTATLLNTAVPAISGVAQSGETLTAEPGLWEASSTIEYAYQWLRCDTTTQSCTAIPGATESTYAAGEEDVGHAIEVAVTAKGTWGEATVPSDPTSVVLPPPTAPENTSEPTVARYANEGETLTVGNGTWTGTEPITYTYQWQRCYFECTEISGATSATYTVGEADVGNYLIVAVTATNAAGESTVPVGTEVIGNTEAPAVRVAPAILGEAKDLQPLYFENGEWSGSQPITQVYQWDRCNETGGECTAISGAVEQPYQAASADIGHTLRATDTATNVHGTATYTSEPTAVVVANPAHGAAPTITGDDYLGETLTANVHEVTGTSPVETSYQWKRCNTSGESCTEISGASEPTYTLVAADTGSTIKVTTTYTNAYGVNSETSAATATIQDTAPGYASGLHLTSSTQDFTVPGVILTAHAGTWHGSAPVEYSYQWQHCNSSGGSCANISGATSSTYTVTESDEETYLGIVVTATNAQGSASEHLGGFQVYVPQGPLLPTNPEITGTARDGETLTAESHVIWNPTSITYQWQHCILGLGIGCTNISGATSQTYTLGIDDDGWRIRVIVTASNTHGSDSSESSWTPAVQALPPVNTSPPSISGETIVGGPLEAEAGTWTGTTSSLFGGSPGYEYQWQLCDAEGHECHSITGATSGRYTPPAEDLGQTIRLVAKALSPQSWTPGTRASATATSEVTAALGAATAATNTAAPALSGTAQDGQELSVTNGTWTGSPTIEYSYHWRRCNTAGESCTDIEGANQATYSIRSADIAHTVRAVVTASNGAGAVSATTSASETVASPVAPTLVTEPTFGFFAEQRIGIEDFVTDGTWTGDPTITYQWQRCDTSGTGAPVCTDITGATQHSYIPQPADIGYALNRVETATNETGSETAETGPEHQLVQPQNIAADNQNGASGGTYTGALVPGHTITADSLVHSTPELPVTTTYTFNLMDSAHTQLGEINSSSPNLTITSWDLGYQIKITMTSTVWRADEAIAVGTDTVATYTGHVEVAPTNDTLPSITGEAVQGAPLAADHGEWHGGGGTLDYAYQWRRCNSSGASCTDITGATASTYTNTASDVGHTLRVTVTAENQGASGTATSAHTETVTAASALTSTSAPTISGEATDLQTLTASTGEWSGSTPTSYAYQWESCDSEGGECSEVPAATNTTYTVEGGDVGGTVRVTVTASNGAGTTSAASAATSVIAGAPAPANLTRPSITLLGPPQPGASATTDSGSWQNISSEPALRTLSYQWERCNTEGGECQAIEEATNQTYTVAEADSSKRLRVTVTAQNETGRTSSTSPLGAEIGETAAMGSEKMLYTTGSALYTASPEGSEAHELTSCPTADSEAGEAGCMFGHPSISPTGEMIAAATNVHGWCGDSQLCPNEDTKAEDRIMLMNYDGSEPRILPGNGSQPTWSPDGTSITYTRTVEDPEGEGTITRLYRVKADGSNATSPVPVETGTAISESPAYSPDGGQLAYAGRESPSEQWGLYTANADGHEATRMHIEGVGNIDDPQYTLDGSKIIFLATEPAPPPHTYPSPGPNVTRSIYSINPDGTGLHRITEDEEDNSSPAPANENEIIVTRSSIEILDFSGGGIAIVKKPGRIETIPIEGGTPTPHPELPTENGIKDVTVGVLGPRAHAAFTQVCPKAKKVCGIWTRKNTEAAYQYAKEWAERPNPQFHQEENDCADYVSQLLHAGGMQMLRAYEYGTDSWWAQLVPVQYPHYIPNHSESWVLVEKLYHQLRNTGVARPLRATETPHAGDIVFFHWGPEKKILNHVGMIVAGNNHNPSTEIFTSHTANRRWSMEEEGKAIGRYLHELDHSIAPNEIARKDHWEWYILRPIHTSAYVEP